MIRLREIQISVAYYDTKTSQFGINFRPSPYLKSSDCGFLRRNAAVIGFIATALMRVPSNVTLRWGQWSSLLRGRTMWKMGELPEYWNLLMPEFLESMAAEFVPVRSRRAVVDIPRVVIDLTKDTGVEEGEVMPTIDKEELYVV